MQEVTMNEQRPQSSREEFVNAASHALGFLAALAALPVLAWYSILRPTPQHLGAWIFAATLLLVYLASAVYHAVPAGRWKQALCRLDQAAIFLFIAGSYTPFALRNVPGGATWLLLGGVWAAAALGMALKLLDRLQHQGWLTALYFAFGWLVLLAAQPVVDGLPRQGLALVLGGGVAYTVGTVFFLLDQRLRYGHLVWHLFALLGSACHFVVVLRYVG
jgi:hemolysin III